MALKPKMPPLQAEPVEFVPHETIEVVHPDGFIQLFWGFPATIYKMTEFVDGKEAALELARGLMKDLAIKAYYPVKGNPNCNEKTKSEWNKRLAIKKAAEKKERRRNGQSNPAGEDR